MISPDLILFAVRSAVRLGRAASLELEAHIRNRDVKLPGVLRVPRRPGDTIRNAVDLESDSLLPEQKATYLRLREEWHATGGVGPAASAAERGLAAFARDIGMADVAEAAEYDIGLVTIAQWSDAARQTQVQPLARIGLALVEVAVDYATTNPGMFGLGSNGERFVKALTSAIDEILPNSGTVKARITVADIFQERSVAILMHSGLSALQDHVTDNVGEAHLRDISVAVLGPLVRNFEGGKIARKTLVEYRELLLGPMAREAILAVARNQRTFLGSRFGDNKALGAVGQAILVAVAEEKDANGAATWDLSDLADRETWTRIYGAVLDVAIARPELFAGQSAEHDSKFGRELVQTVALRLKEMKDSPFTKTAAVAIVADAIVVLSRNTLVFFDEDKPWDDVARGTLSSVLASVSAGMTEGLAAGSAAAARTVLARVFSEDQVAALVRAVLVQVARTPGMVTGDDKRDEVKTLVAGIAKGISDRNSGLLSSDDWLDIAAIVAEQAARNPGRLFRIVDANGQPVPVEREFAVRAIAVMLDAAAKDLRDHGRAKGSVMFGATLKEAIGTIIETAADNAEAVAKDDALIVGLVERVTALQRQGPVRFGSAGWLRVLRGAARQVLLAEKGAEALTALTDDALLDMLRQ